MKFFFAATLTSIICLHCMLVNAQTERDQSKQNPWLKDQQDQTDLYEIPLGSSEAEEEAEEQHLKNEEKRLQQH